MFWESVRAVPTGHVVKVYLELQGHVVQYSLIHSRKCIPWVYVFRDVSNTSVCRGNDVGCTQHCWVPSTKCVLGVLQEDLIHYSVCMWSCRVCPDSMCALAVGKAGQFI